MNNLFVIGDEFSSKTYISGLQYLLNEKFDNIYLLSETNKYNDVFAGVDCPIIIADNIDVCLANCETLLVIYSYYFTEYMFERIVKSYKLHGKKVYKINTKDDALNDVVENNTLKQCSLLPVVLVIDFSAYAQSYIVELALNKCLVENGVDVYQVFSPKSQSVLNSLKKESVLNSLICNTLDASKNKALLVKTIVFSDIDTFTADINPIYSVLVTEAGMSQNIYDLFNEFGVRYGITLNAIVVSQFETLNLWRDRTDLLYKGDMEVYLANKNVLQNSKFGLATLVDDMVSRISLPDGVDIIDININN